MVDAEELVVDSLGHGEDLGLLVLVSAFSLALLDELLHLILFLERLRETVELSPEGLDTVVVRDLLFDSLELLICGLVLRHKGLMLVSLFAKLRAQVAFSPRNVLNRRSLVDGGVESREGVAFLLHL